MSEQLSRVVIEYRFAGYTPPEDTEAWCVFCSIPHTDVPLRKRFDVSLLDVRGVLEQLGFTQHGVEQLRGKKNTYRHDRYEPTWREVWTTEDPLVRGPSHA